MTVTTRSRAIAGSRAWSAPQSGRHRTMPLGRRRGAGRRFSVVRKRWVVERTNPWDGRSRHNSQDYERTTASAEAMIQIRAIPLLLHRLAPHDVPVTFHYRVSTVTPTTVAAGEHQTFSESLSESSTHSENLDHKNQHEWRRTEFCLPHPCPG